MAAQEPTKFWNEAAGTKTFTHPLDHSRLPAANFVVNDGGTLPFAAGSFDAVLLFAVLTCIPDDRAQKNLLAELKRTLRRGGLLLISDYPLQADARNLERYAKFAPAARAHGSFRLPDGTLLRHHRREWFAELLADFEIEAAVERDVSTMTQFWCRRFA